jgi:hypothetical protein
MVVLVFFKVKVIFYNIQELALLEEIENGSYNSKNK